MQSMRLAFISRGRDLRAIHENSRTAGLAFPRGQTKLGSFTKIETIGIRPFVMLGPFQPQSQRMGKIPQKPLTGHCSGTPGQEGSFGAKSTDRPSRIRKNPQKKTKFIQVAGNWRSILGTQTCFLATFAAKQCLSTYPRLGRADILTLLRITLFGHRRFLMVV